MSKIYHFIYNTAKFAANCYMPEVCRQQVLT